MFKEYWNRFYVANKEENQEPSLFAVYVLTNFLKKGDRLIELGCGNGRDAVYMARHGINVVAVDQCDEGVLNLMKNRIIESLSFDNADFTCLPDGLLYDHVYSRFTMHSISSEQEKGVIQWAYRNLKPGGYFFIEARGEKNEIYKLGTPVSNEVNAYIYENHYRRFLNNDLFVKSLKDVGFTIVYNEEKKDFAPYKGSNETFIRLICRK